MKFPDVFYNESASIEPFAGTSGDGRQVFGTATRAACMVQPGNRLVRDSQGNQVVSSTTLYCPRGTSAPAASRVTVRGDVRVVIGAKPWSAGRMLPEFVEVMLQ